MRAGKALSTIVAALLLSACSEVTLTKPDLALTPKPVSLTPPLELQVLDDQAAERSGDYAKHLALAIKSAYPQAIELADALPVAGHANLTLHIHFLGAHFNRTPDAVLRDTPDLSVARGTIDGWAPVVAAAAGQGPVSGGTVFKYLPGNWSGIVYLDADIRDLRPGHTAALTIPIADEESAPNQLGALQAAMQASAAWNAAAPRLSALLDATIGKLAAEQR